MSLFLLFLFLGLGFTQFISSFRWRLSKELLSNLDLSSYQVFNKKEVLASAKLRAGETLGIPIKCHVIISGREMHLIPVRFSPLLFMTDFPFSFLKADNKKIKVNHSENHAIKFRCRKRKSSIFGSTFDVTIGVNDADEKKELLKLVKSWR